MNSKSKTNQNVKETGQFGLLTTRRFAPFFWTQFFGAFNDNVYKNALILFIAYKASQSMAGNSDMFINMSAGLFILPFFLFSATAGQIADKFEKSALIRKIKLMEIVIMATAALAFFFNSIILLMALLFFMGTQSTFFGPVKYSIIPQHLKETEIVGGNAMVEMGTFVAILIGTITGGILSQLEGGELRIGAGVVFFALCGWIASRSIPEAKAVAPDLKINWNLFTETWKNVKDAKKQRIAWLSILAISWFWFVGAAYLTQLPNFTKDVLKGSEGVVTLLLAMFSVGVGAGSLLCEKISGKKVQPGLIPFGLLGMSIFGIDLALAYETPAAAGLMTISQFLGTSGSIRVLVDLTMVGVFGGLYIVPLYALMQIKSKPETRSRIIATNNIMNALYMVASAGLAILLLGVAGLSIPQFFLVLAGMSFVVAGYIFTKVPKNVIVMITSTIMRIMYRIKRVDLDMIPEEGAAVLVSNHVTFIDALLIAASCKRNIRFVMDDMYYHASGLNYIFRTTGVIPIAPKHEKPDVYEKGFDEISQALKNGELVCIFPEGSLTRDGEIDMFKPGIEKIIKRDPVPVIPLTLKGLWGSFFSYEGGTAMAKRPRRFWSHIEIVAEAPVEPRLASVENLYNIVSNMRGETS
ncbi:MAG: MFS transporter [bacterium]|nr:MFS transporter [bacterium]